MSRRAAPAAVVAVVAILALGGCRGESSPAPSRSPGSAGNATPSVAPGGSATAPTTPQVSSSAHQTRPIPPDFVIHIRGYAYRPAAPVVAVGQRLQIVNDDSAAHTWSAAPGAGWQYTSGNLDKGQRATFVGFAKPGKYKFLCYYHAEMPTMNGTVTVHAAS